MRFAMFALCGVLVGCGGTAAPDMDAWDSEVAAFRQRVTEYRARAATTSAPTDCRAELDRYRADAEPRLRRLAGMSGSMDGCMSAMGHMSEADSSAVCDEMSSELRRYAAAGCQAVNSADNRATAEVHCDRMLGYFDHHQGRSTALRGMMGASGMMMGDRTCR